MEKKRKIRNGLIEELGREGAFWSFDLSAPAQVPDEWLIEKTLLHLDLDSIYRLFDLFPKVEIRRVWEERLVPDTRQHSLNLLFAFLLFQIEQPEQFLKSKVG